MKSALITLLCFCYLIASAQEDTVQRIVPNRTNSKTQQHKPYVILISSDAFRYDYAKKYNAEHLLALSNSGVSAASMIPSFPSITFPNHYTLVTGMYPAHHGLVGNQFYDKALGRAYNYKGPSSREGIWYHGTPLWVVAEKQKMITAAFWWVGSEAEIDGVRPTYYYNYNEKITIHQRIQAIKNWLKLPPEKRPHLITIYFPEVDHASHKHGPDSKETEQAVHLIDSAVYELTKAVKSTGLKANFVFVSDHGMAHIPTDAPIKTPEIIDTNKFTVTGETTTMRLYAHKGDEDAIISTYQSLLKGAKEYSVYLRTNFPAKYHYSGADDKYNRTGDIVLLPHFPHVFLLKGTYVDPGQHGFDPYVVKDMHATFYAWGPNFKKHLQIPSFQNINVFPIITKILGLNNKEKIDGKSAIADKIAQR